ncbi:MAG TPA: hypothetical protein VGO62_20635 [Myxococcota bacterium]|jgi:hypothetical protein
MHALALVIAIAAQVAPAPPPVQRATRVTHIVVDDDVIEASPARQADTFVARPRPHAHRSLILVRTSFAPELLASAAELSGK